MEKNTNKEQDDHDQLPSDKALKDKIHTHLSNIDDTISADDLKNINTSTGTENSIVIPDENSRENNIDEDKDLNDENIKPKKEMPTSWDING